MKQKYLFILTLLLTVQGVIAQVTFKTTVSKSELGLNERLRIEFSIDRQGGDDFTPPDFKNFKVLAGPSQSSSFSSINGKTSYKLTYTYILQPTAKGTLRFHLPRLPIMVNRSNPIPSGFRLQMRLKFLKTQMIPDIWLSRIFIW